jgi:uncharacterized protein YbaR (Trm112 family)
MQPEFLKLLVCPVTRSPLAALDTPTLDRVNQAIAKGSLRNQAGKLVERPIQAALLRSDGEMIYPIVDHIPLLLPEEGISMSQCS